MTIDPYAIPNAKNVKLMTAGQNIESSITDSLPVQMIFDLLTQKDNFVVQILTKIFHRKNVYFFYFS